MSEHTNAADPKPPSVDRLSQLWHRVNEHKMAQWSVAYVALAYAIQHAVVLTREAFEWPQSVERISMLLLVLGLPLVMTLAWYHGQRASRQFFAPLQSQTKSSAPMWRHTERWEPTGTASFSPRID